MQYTELTEAEQLQILAQRQKQYEGEHFNHLTNKELLVATGAKDETTKKLIEDADAAMETLDKAHATTVKKIKELKKKVEPPETTP